jgi:PD-(D/E)XK endonuclease
MDTKLKGEIAEQAAIFHTLKRGWGVLRPVGDRLPYDLVKDNSLKLLIEPEASEH